MDNPTTTRNTFVAAGYGLVLAFVFFLLFYRLDNHLLWGDEAETAVLARNVTRFGVPQTCDGTNYILLHGRMDETPSHVWIWSPWLQEYFAAGSFILFGATTWAARAPFALIGGCCVAALGLVAYKSHRSHWVALSSIVLLGTSEVFLLHARQCRYYPISVFGEILLVYGVYRMFARDRRGIWLAAAALVLQFYSNYIIAVANLPVLPVLAWMFRRVGRRAVLSVAAIPGILAVAALPWLVYAHPWGQTRVIGAENYWLKALGYLGEFHFHFIPLCILLLPILGLLPPGRKQRTPEPEATQRWERFLWILLPSYLVTVLIIPGFYLRYLLPVLPVACLLTAVWIFRYLPWRMPAVVLVTVLALSNVLSVLTAWPVCRTHPLRFPLVDFVRGLTVPYTDRLNDVLDFLKQRAHPGELVLTFDPDFPLIFYTPLKILDGQLMGPPPGQLPDWILPVSPSGIVAQDPVPLPEFLKPRYERITIPVLDSVQADSIPEPDIYQYQNVRTRVPFVLYQLKPAGTNDFSPGAASPGHS